MAGGSDLTIARISMLQCNGAGTTGDASTHWSFYDRPLEIFSAPQFVTETAKLITQLED